MTQNLRSLLLHKRSPGKWMRHVRSFRKVEAVVPPESETGGYDYRRGKQQDHGWGYGGLGVYSERLTLDHSGQEFFKIFWNTVDLQCCVNFCGTTKWYVHSSSYSFPLSQNIEYGSLWYTVGPCCLSILCITVCIRSSQRSRILEAWPSGSESFPLKLLQSFMHEFSFYQTSKGIHD